MDGESDLELRRRQKVAEEDHPTASLHGRTDIVRTLVDEPDLDLFPWEYQPQGCRIGVDQAPAEEERERHTVVWVTVAGDADRLEGAVRTSGVRLRWESGPREGRTVPERPTIGLG